MAGAEETKTISLSTYQTMLQAARDIVELRAQVARERAEKEQAQQQLKTIVGTVFKFTATFGLNTPDGKSLRPSILEGTEKPIKSVMKAVLDLGQRGFMAQTSKAAQEKLEQDFSFFKNLVPVIDYYNTL